MQRPEDTIAIPADPDDPDDFNVSEAALQQALVERQVRMRGVQRAPTKQQVTLRLDPEVLAKFRATGRGWQARINAALKDAQV
jgi:uncharacterized protein (DUF4415 family)